MPKFDTRGGIFPRIQNCRKKHVTARCVAFFNSFQKEQQNVGGRRVPASQRRTYFRNHPREVHTLHIRPSEKPAKFKTMPKEKRIFFRRENLAG